MAADIDDSIKRKRMRVLLNNCFVDHVDDATKRDGAAADLMEAVLATLALNPPRNGTQMHYAIITIYILLPSIWYSFRFSVASRPGHCG